MKQVISIVVPCYNEEEALPVTAKKIEEKITALKKNDKFKFSKNVS
jgi:glycosyltransferase involved in cell wall biosynthesis